MTTINNFPITAKKISENPEATGLIDGNEIMSVIQGGVNKKIASNNFHDFYKKQADILGLFEYSVDTEYVLGSLARQTGTSNIYKSLVNANLSNSLIDPTKWELCGSLSNLLKIPTTYKIVGVEEDFGVPSGGKIVLTSGITYIVNETTILTNTLVVPAGGDIMIVSAALTKALVYVGTGNMWETPDDYGIVVLREIICTSPAGTMFSFDEVEGQWFSISTIYINAAAGGIIKNAGFTLFFCQLNSFGSSLTFENNSIQVALPNCSIEGWTNIGTPMLIFKGEIRDISINGTKISPNGANTALDFQSSLETFGTSISINTSVFAGETAFAPNSLKQDYKNSYFIGNLGIPDSTISTQLAFKGSALNTDIITTNVRAVINAAWQTQLTERMLLVDHCIFNNLGNTITTTLVDNVTTYNHLLQNGRKIKFKTSGTLPPEILPDVLYYIISATATTFQISTTFNGSLVNFTTNGAGVHYLLHREGVNRASWLLYDGTVDEKVNIVGSVSGLGLVAGDKVFFASVVKLNSSLVETSDLDLFGEGSDANVDNFIAGSSTISCITSLMPQESLRFYITNATDNADINIRKSSLIFTKI